MVTSTAATVITAVSSTITIEVGTCPRVFISRGTDGDADWDGLRSLGLESCTIVPVA